MAKLSKKEAHKRAKFFITDILELGNELVVRDDDRITWAGSEDDILIVPDKNVPAKTLYVYSIDVQNPNGIVLNPINETVVMSQDHKWFYNTINKLLRTTFCKVLVAIIDTAISAKKDISVLKDPAIVHLLTPFVNDVDEKMRSEIELITDRKSDDPINNIINIKYSKKSQSAGVYTLFQDKNQEFIKNFGNKVRKKFWTLLEKVFQEVFSKEEINTETPIYEVKKEGQYACPRFRTMIDAYIYVWKMMLPFYPLIYSNEDFVDKITDQIQNSLINLEEFEDFYDVCFWASTPVASEELKKPLRTIIDNEPKGSGALEALGYRDNRVSYPSFQQPIPQNEPEWKRSLGLDSRYTNTQPMYNNYNQYDNRGGYYDNYSNQMYDNRGYGYRVISSGRF